MSDEPFEIFKKKPKRKKKPTLEERREKAENKGFSKRDIAIVKAHLVDPDATLKEKAAAAGLVGKEATVTDQVRKTLRRVSDKISANQRLQELLSLKNAGVEKIADVMADAMNAQTPFRGRETEVMPDGKLVTKDVTKMFPDHRVRVEAAKFSAEALQAMPDKKVVIEEFKYEQKVELKAQIIANPGMLADLQRLLEQKRQEGGE